MNLMEFEGMEIRGAQRATSYLDNVYVKATIPPYPTGDRPSYIIIHGVARVTAEQYRTGVIDGDTIIIRQSENDKVKLNWNHKNETLKMRLIGINAHEVAHGDNAESQWTESQKKGAHARDWMLTVLGMDVEALKRGVDQESTELTIVVDKTQINTGIADEDGLKITLEPGMDIHGRYLAEIFCSHPRTLETLSLNKSAIIQNFGTKPFLFYDKNNNANVSSIFNVHEYETLYRLFINDEAAVKPSTSGAVNEEAVDDRMNIALDLGYNTDHQVDTLTIIGDSVFFIPPTSVTVSKNVKSDKLQIVRSKGSIDRGTGHSELQISMQLFFAGEEMINGYPYTTTLPNGDSITYHMNGLRQLIAQFRKTPFLPITNKYVNFTYNIEAVALADLSISTVPDFPGLIKVDLIMTDFEPRVHITGLDATERFEELFHWPLFRYYYQKSFDASEANKGHAYLKPVPERLNGEVKFSLLSDDQLNQLSQQANITGWNKVKPGAGIIDGDIDNYLLGKGFPQALKDNYTTYVSYVKAYEDFLKYCKVKRDGGNNKDVEELLKAYLSEQKLEDSNLFLRVLDNNVAFYLRIPLTMPFLYFRRDDDYILAENYYELKLLKPKSGTEHMYKYTVKLDHHNDFRFHPEFLIRTYNANNGMSKKLMHERNLKVLEDQKVANGMLSSIMYAIFLTYNGLEDRIITKTTDESPLIIAPDRMNVNFHPGELNVEGIITDPELLKMHAEVCSGIADQPYARMSTIAERIIDKYDLYVKERENAIKKLEVNEVDERNEDALRNQNYLDDLELDFKPLEIFDSPTSVAIGMSNTFAHMQLLSLPTPTKQYMGGTDIVIKLDYVVDGRSEVIDGKNTGKDTISKLNYMFEYSTHLVRRYRTYISDGFIKVENELINMMGVNYVLIQSVDVKELPDYPEWYRISVNLIAFDRTQRNKEELKKIATGDEEFLGTDGSIRKVSNARIGTYQRLIDTLKTSEVYPDLELPTLIELIEKGFIVNPNGGKYADPDFYISYGDRFMFSSEIAKYIVDPTDLGEAVAFDAHTGDSLTFDISRPVDGFTQSDTLKETFQVVSAKIDPLENNVRSKALAEGDISVRYADNDNLNKTISESLVKGKELANDTGYYNSITSFLGMTLGTTKPYLGSGSENLKKLSSHIAPYGNIHPLTIAHNGTKFPKDTAHSTLEKLCDSYGITHDTVVRGIIHNLFEAESDATHWQSYDDSTGNKIVKSNIQDATSLTDFTSATKVGIASLNLKDSTYDSITKDALINNPAANMQFGLDKLVSCYLRTFNYNGYGIYSKLEETGKATDGATDKVEFMTAKDGENPYANLKIPDDYKKIIAKPTGHNPYEQTMFDNSIQFKTWTKYNTWYDEKRGAAAKDPVLRAFRSIPENKQLIDAAIDNRSKDQYKLSAEERALQEALKKLVEQCRQIVVSGDPSARITVSRNPGDYAKSEYNPNGYTTYKSTDIIYTSNGASMDIEFERARWLVASFIYAGFEYMTSSHYNAIFQYIEGGFSMAAIKVSGVDGLFQSAVGKRIGRIRLDNWSMKMLSAAGTYDIVDLVGRSNMQDGVESFGEYHGDPAFVISHDDILKSSLHDAVNFDRRGRLCRAFPTFFICIVDEGNSLFNWKMHDNFYGYNAINELQVIRSRKMAASTCIMRMSNLFNSYWNWDEDSLFRRQSTFPEVVESIFNTEEYVKGTAKKYRDADASMAMLKAGARLHVRLGYSSNVRSMPVLFNGTIAEISQGDVIEVIAQGDGIELTNKIPASPKETLGDESTLSNDNIVERVFNAVSGGTTEPRNVILDLFHTKGGFWKKLIYNLSDGFLFNKNPLGIVHFGNPEFKIIFADGGEVSQNVYAGMSPIIVNTSTGPKSVVAFQDSANVFAKDDEPNFSMFIYNKTPWDIIQVCRMLVPDFIASVEPFEFRSTLFYGKPYYPFAYEYDYSTIDVEQIRTMLESVTTPTEAIETITAVNRSVQTSQATSTTRHYTKNPNAKIAWDFFRAKGYSEAATAGILGNLQQESGIDPAKVQYGGGPGRGIAQWTVTERWRELQHWATYRNKDHESLITQLEFLVVEMEGSQKHYFVSSAKTTHDAFKVATDYKWATAAWEKAIERAGQPMMERRYQYAHAFLMEFTGSVIEAAYDTPEAQEINIVKRKLISYIETHNTAPIKERRKSFQQAHVFTSTTDIIGNKIKASERGVYTNVIGNFAGQKAAMSKGTFQTPTIYADTDIWDEKQKTAMVDCQLYAKGIPILGLIPFVNKTKIFFFDQAKAINIATAALMDYMKDMYQGELIILGYPSIKPHDMMFIEDQYNQMHGLTEVQQVIHHFSVHQGFITSLTPDACVTQHDQYMKQRWITVGNTIGVLATYGVAKLLSAFFGAKVLGFSRMAVGFAGKFGHSAFGMTMKAKNFITDTSIFQNIVKHADEMRDTAKVVSESAKAADKIKEMTKGKEYLAKIADLMKDSSKTLKEVGELSVKYTDDFVKLTKVGVAAVMIAEIIALEIAERALVTWIKRFIRNRQALSMTLLKQHGKELSAGINGHRGLVMGDTPSIKDKIVKGLFGSEAASWILGGDVKELVNTIYTPSTGKVDVHDSKYREQYRSDYIKNCETSLGEVATLLASGDRMSDYQIQHYIQGDSLSVPRVMSYSNIVAYANTRKGYPYTWGNSGQLLTNAKIEQLKEAARVSPRNSHFKPEMYNFVGQPSYDCGGLMVDIYRYFGVSLPMGTMNQILMGRAVEKSDVKVGDLVFTSSEHVTMYIGGGELIHAPQTGDVVRTRKMPDKVYAIRRIIEDLDDYGRKNPVVSQSEKKQSSPSVPTGQNQIMMEQ